MSFSNNRKNHKELKALEADIRLGDEEALRETIALSLHNVRRILKDLPATERRQAIAHLTTTPESYLELNDLINDIELDEN
jgi:hypothetical protein